MYYRVGLDFVVVVVVVGGGGSLLLDQLNSPRSHSNRLLRNTLRNQFQVERSTTIHHYLRRRKRVLKKKKKKVPYRKR